MKNMVCKISIFLLPMCMIAVVVCTDLGYLAGAGSETTNSLTGTIAKANGTAASRTIVQLIPQSYNIE
jgi:hypothetical protein